MRKEEEKRIQRIIAILEDIKMLIIIKNEPRPEPQPEPQPGPQPEPHPQPEEDDNEFFNLMNLMRYYSEIPADCFERYLTQIMCAIFLKIDNPSPA